MYSFFYGFILYRFILLMLFLSEDKGIWVTMNKKQIFVFALLILIPVFAYSVRAKAAITSDNVLEMNTKATSLNKGDVVEVTFHVKNLPTAGFAGYLNYDEAVLGKIESSNVIVPNYNSAVTGATSGAGVTVTPTYGSWLAFYNAESKRLEVKEQNGKAVTLPTNSNGLLLTIKFVVQKSATNTTIQFSYPEVYKSDNGINNYPNGLTLEIKNTKTKRFVLATDAVKGHNKISIPVNATANDGIMKFSISASFDPSKLVFDSITGVDSVSRMYTLDSYTIMDAGKKLVVNYSSTADQRPVGTLFYINFHALDIVGQKETTGTTDVLLKVESISDKNESSFLLNEAKSFVTITEKEHVLGDINGNEKIDLVDALYVIQYYNKYRALSQVELDAADVNKNKTVDLVDALMIMQFYNGTIKAL